METTYCQKVSEQIQRPLRDQEREMAGQCESLGMGEGEAIPVMFAVHVTAVEQLLGRSPTFSEMVGVRADWLAGFAPEWTAGRLRHRDDDGDWGGDVSMIPSDRVDF